MNQNEFKSRTFTAFDSIRFRVERNPVDGVQMCAFFTNPNDGETVCMIRRENEPNDVYRVRVRAARNILFIHPDLTAPEAKYYAGKKAEMYAFYRSQFLSEMGGDFYRVQA